MSTVYSVEKQLIDSKTSIVVNVPGKLVVNARKTVCRGVSKNINVPGFRPGKVPVSVMKRQIGAQQFDDLLMNELLSTSFYAALEQEKLSPVTEAEFSDKKVEGDNFSFRATFFVAPEIELGDYQKLEVEAVAQEEVTEDAIDQDIRRTLISHAEKTELDEMALVENGHQIYVLAKGKIDGESNALLRHYNTPIIVGQNDLYPEFDHNFIGKKKLERVQVNYTFPTDHAVKGFAGKTAELDVKILSHYKLEIPELSDELVKDKLKVDSIFDLRTSVKSQMESVNQKTFRDKEMKAVQDALYKITQCTVPETLVNELSTAKKTDLNTSLEEGNRTFADYLLSQGQTEEEYNKQQYEESLRELTLSFALSKIAELESLEVDEKMVLWRVRYLSYYYRRSYRDLLEFIDARGRRPLIRSEINQERAMDFLMKKYGTSSEDESEEGTDNSAAETANNEVIVEAAAESVAEMEVKEQA